MKMDWPHSVIDPSRVEASMRVYLVVGEGFNDGQDLCIHYHTHGTLREAEIERKALIRNDTLGLHYAILESEVVN